MRPSGDDAMEVMQRVTEGANEGNVYVERAVEALAAAQATEGELQRQHEGVALSRCAAALLGRADDRHVQRASLIVATITAQRLGRLEATVDERIPGDLGSGS